MIGPYFEKGEMGMLRIAKFSDSSEFRPSIFIEE